MFYLNLMIEWLKVPQNPYKVLSVLCAIAMFGTYGDPEERTWYVVFSALLVYGIIRGWWIGRDV